MPPLRTLAALSCVTLLAACAQPLAVHPTPNAALLLPCIDPALADPETATDNDMAVMMLGLAKAYVDCKRRQADLTAWVRGQ